MIYLLIAQLEAYVTLKNMKTRAGYACPCYIIQKKSEVF